MECGLCAVRVSGEAAEQVLEDEMVLACRTTIAPGMEVVTQDDQLAARRLRRLAEILEHHPHICLTCPQREGCTRDSCTFGYDPEATCCDMFGRCEIGLLYAYLDPRGTLPSVAAAVPREASIEGRIRREPGLCVGCGRCVVVCSRSDDAGDVLELAPGGTARPKGGSLRASGCTFCGMCVLVCPTGALTAPGDKGVVWLAERREGSGLAAPVLPPEPRLRVDPVTLSSLPQRPGVFRLMDEDGRVLLISGVPDLRRGLARALADLSGSSSLPSSARCFTAHESQLYTQLESEHLTAYAQEHGHLPPGNDPCDELFDDLDDPDLD